MVRLAVVDVTKPKMWIQGHHATDSHSSKLDRLCIQTALYCSSRDWSLHPTRLICLLSQLMHMPVVVLSLVQPRDTPGTISARFLVRGVAGRRTGLELLYTRDKQRKRRRALIALVGSYSTAEQVVVLLNTSIATV